jgi:CheY-like chemotaxis protein
MLRKKILVIDDDPVVAQSIHRFLRQVVPASWEVAHETDPKVGLLRAVTDQAIALCFVDLLMPALGGDQLIEMALRQRPDLRGRIAVCSGAMPNSDAEKRLFGELGCLRIDKPFTLEELERFVWRFIAEEYDRA